MNQTDCPRCGASMESGGVCPVCEIPHLAQDGRAPMSIEPPAATLIGRLWQNGRLHVALAAVCFALGTLLTLATVQIPGVSLPRQVLTALQVIVGTPLYGTTMRSTTLVALPGASAGLVSFLVSRRTRADMFAARPLVLVASVLPLMAVVLFVLKLGRRHHLDYSFGPGTGLVALGVLFGVMAALRFGCGIKDGPSGRHQTEDED